MPDNITINIVEPTDQSVTIGISGAVESFSVNNFPADQSVTIGISSVIDSFSINAFSSEAIWGSIVGALSAQSDLWAYLSAETFSPSQLTAFLATNYVNLCSINVNGVLLSGGTNLLSIFSTIDNDSQTLTFFPSSASLTISNGNTVVLSSIVVAPSTNAVFETVSAIALSGIFYGDGSNLTGISPFFQLKILTETETTLSAGQFNTFFKTVSNDNNFIYSNINSGQTITLYLSANHGTVKRHTLPSPTYLSNASESNEIYTYEGYITKTTIQRIGNEYYGVSNVIKKDISQNIGAIGRILLDQSFNFLLQENSDKLLLETN